MTRVLSDEQLAFFAEWGYVILPDAAPPAMLQAVIDATWDFLDMSPEEPETWYRKPERVNGMAELNGAGMVEMYNHPALWDVRQLPRIHGAFADIWGTEKLWVTIDRVNMNPPNRPGFEFTGFIHWDIDTTLDPLPFDVQGVLSLSDTPAGQGGFQCVPGMPKRLPEWIETQPADRNPNRPDLTGLSVETVETRAGDLLIWNSQLPHGVSPNTSDRPRLAQYLSMSPALSTDAAVRQWRINSWLHRIAPEGMAFPGDPRERERRQGDTASLTPLGRKLLGLDLWDEMEATAKTYNVELRSGRKQWPGRPTPGFGG